MANIRNPDSNSVLQALLDLTDRGMGTWKVDDLITRISTDPKLRADLQKAWNAHAYPEKAMVYAQLGIDQRLFELSDAGYKVISLLGMYCHQSGLIQAKLDDICAAVKVGRTSAKAAVAELRKCGALDIAVPSIRHAAPVYRVNPALINKGTRRNTDVSAFTAQLSIDPGDYILNKDPELVVQTDIIRNADIVYNKLYLVPPDEAKPAKKRPSRRKKAADVQLPGQMDIFDVLGGADREA